MLLVIVSGLSIVRSSTAPLIEAHARNGSARLTEREEERGTEECRRNSQDRLLPNGSRDSISRHPKPANPARQRAHQRQTRPATCSLACSLAHHPIISPKRPPPSIKRSAIAIDTDRSGPLINSGCFARFARCFWHRSSVPPSSTCYVSAVTAMMFRGIQSASWLIYVESWSPKLFRTALACKVRTHSTFHSWIACPMQQHPSLLNADLERCLRYKCRECVHFISSSRPAAHSLAS